MNLEGKYILLKRENIRETINFLYREGYHFMDSEKSEMIEKLYSMNNDLYLILLSEFIAYGFYESIKNSNMKYIIHDIKNYIRKAKLENILK